MSRRFITFEGIEGSGKSTLSKKLYEFFRSKSLGCILTREPGGTKAGEMVREVLIHDTNEKLHPITEVLLNFAARLEHVEKLIKPALQQNKIVICDRFFDSTYAYQAGGFGVDEALINRVREVAIGDFVPDITFLIDLPVETALARIESRTTNNRYDRLSVDFHQKVRDRFLSLAEKNSRIVKIDGTKSVEEIFSETLKSLPPLELFVD